MLGPQGPAIASREPAAAAMLKAKTHSDQPLCLTCQGVLKDQVISERQSMVPKVELGSVHIQDSTMQGPMPTVHCGDGPVLLGGLGSEGLW